MMTSPFPSTARAVALTSAIAALLLTATSCGDDTHGFGTPAGRLVPRVNVITAIEGEYTAGEIYGPGYTFPTPDDFSLVITDASGMYGGQWESVADYPQQEAVNIGQYTLTAFTPGDIEGFGTPAFMGIATYSVCEDDVVDAVIDCRLAGAVVKVEYTDAAIRYFKTVEAILHSSGGGSYFSYPVSESRPLLLLPGDMTVDVAMTLSDGRSVTIAAATLPAIEAAHCYSLTVDVDTSAQPQLVVTTSASTEDSRRIPLTDELFDSPGPQVTTEGFESGIPLSIIEGDDPPARLLMNATSVSALTLTCRCPTLLAKGFPAETDLLHTTPETTEKLRELGLVWGDAGTVDFTEVIPHIDYIPNHSRNELLLQARDAAGRVSEPAALVINTIDADINVTRIGDAVAGIDHATVHITTRITDLAQNLLIETFDNTSGQWNVAEIVDCVHDPASSSYAVTFAIPSGTGDIAVRVSYCDRVKAEGTVKRVSPVYTVEVDAFARMARMRITADTHEMASIIAENISVYDGNKACTVYNRYTDAAIIEVAGLTPSTRYTLTTTVMGSPAYTAGNVPVNFTTESAGEVPNGDFEDYETTIATTRLPSGGRYSQTMVNIFNQQNFTTFTVNTPRHWATTNPKTFCKSAHTKNTWYMHPSVMLSSESPSGNMSVEIVNTAWDTNGAPIPDYAQTSQPYLTYNPNIPAIAHKAVGRLWLGSYSFDPATLSETFHEGIAFSSRPRMLNGLYKYLPGSTASAEKATAIVKVWGRVDGKETEIARGETLLGFCADFTAFSVPVTYNRFGVKATKICIIFAASSDMGSIDHETATVVTLPDPLSATSTGNRLWIDNLTFAY